MELDQQFPRARVVRFEETRYSQVQFIGIDPFDKQVPEHALQGSRWRDQVQDMPSMSSPSFFSQQDIFLSAMKSFYFESLLCLCFYFPPFADYLIFHFDFPFPPTPPPPKFLHISAAFLFPFLNPTLCPYFLYRVHILPLAGFWRPGANLESIELVETTSAILF